MALKHIAIPLNTGSSSTEIELTQSEYDALSDEEKNNGETYLVTDAPNLNMSKLLEKVSFDKNTGKLVMKTIDYRYITLSETNLTVSPANITPIILTPYINNVKVDPSTLSWTSSNTDAGTVENGVVTLSGATGFTIISCTIPEPDHVTHNEAECRINIEYVLVKDIELLESSRELSTPGAVDELEAVLYEGINPAEFDTFEAFVDCQAYNHTLTEGTTSFTDSQYVLESFTYKDEESKQVDKVLNASTVLNLSGMNSGSIIGQTHSFKLFNNLSEADGKLVNVRFRLAQGEVDASRGFPNGTQGTYWNITDAKLRHTL